MLSGPAACLRPPPSVCHRLFAPTRSPLRRNCKATGTAPVAYPLHCSPRRRSSFGPSPERGVHAFAGSGVHSGKSQARHPPQTHPNRIFPLRDGPPRCWSFRCRSSCCRPSRCRLLPAPFQRIGWRSTPHPQHKNADPKEGRRLFRSWPGVADGCYGRVLRPAR